MTDQIEVRITEAEVSKLTLKEGDVLMVTLKGEDFQNENLVDSLRTSLCSAFPNNKIGVIFVDDNHSVEFKTISQGESNEPDSQ